MLKRVFLLSLSLWLMIAGGLAADASPCHMQEEMTPAPISAAETGAHDHCAMMAEEAPTETPADAPALPEAATVAFTLPASFPLDASAPSRTLIPEPPPPKA